MSDDILERKNAFLSYKNKKFKESKKWHFSKGVNPWFWSKNDHFSNFFLLGNIGQENVFDDILEPKNAFLSYKNKKLIKSKNSHFCKGLTHGFSPKLSIFPTFFLGNIGLENVFDDILEPKNTFLHHYAFPKVIYWGLTNLANFGSRGVISSGSH